MPPEIAREDQKSVVSEFEVQKPTQASLRTRTRIYGVKESFPSRYSAVRECLCSVLFSQSSTSVHKVNLMNQLIPQPIKYSSADFL